ncbi:MAG: hypothetical protein K6B65_06680, partial [Bacilli bacterium]|nr:hypothetical protein [Bacilli bacterium]
TCTEQGYTEYVCSRCGDIHHDDFVEAHGHDYHHHDEVLPTCTEGGLCGYDECSICGDIIGYCPLDPLGHHYEVAYTVAPTCTEEGYKIYECKYCHAQRKDDIVPALGHDLITHKAKEPDCTEGWEEYHTCSRCDYTDFVAIPPVNEEHIYESTVVPPTTSSKGYTRHCCKLCGHCYTDSYVPALSPSRMLSAKEAIGLGKAPIATEGSIVKSHRDDDTYYYLIYLGSVLDMPLHSFVSFPFGESTLSLDALPYSTSIPTSTELKSRFDEKLDAIYQKVPKELAEAPLINGIENIVKSNDAALDRKLASEVFASSFASVSPIQVSDPDMEGYASKCKAIKTSYDRDDNAIYAYEVGHTYSYDLVSDIHCFVGASFDLASGKLSYRPLTVVGDPTEKVFCLPQGSADSHRFLSPFHLEEGVEERLIKPSSYATNHPLIEKKFSHPDHVQINYNTDWRFPVSDSNMPTYADQGYDMVAIEMKWKWDRANGKPILFNCELSDTYVLSGIDMDKYSTKEPYKGYWVYDDPNATITWKMESSISTFSVLNGFRMHWRNGGTGLFSAFAQGVKEIYVTFHYYNSSANVDGAYPSVYSL